METENFTDHADNQDFVLQMKFTQKVSAFSGNAGLKPGVWEARLRHRRALAQRSQGRTIAGFRLNPEIGLWKSSQVWNSPSLSFFTLKIGRQKHFREVRSFLILNQETHKSLSLLLLDT